MQLYQEHNDLWNSFCTRTSRHDKSSVKEIITNLILQDCGKDNVKEKCKLIETSPHLEMTLTCT